MAEVRCAQCGATLQRRPSEIARYERFFCDRECRGRWQTEEATIELECEECEEIFTRLRSRIRHRTALCSAECRGRWQARQRTGESAANWRGGPIRRECERCGEEYEVPASWSGSKYCSRDCSAAAQSASFQGEGNPQWRGGVTALRRNRPHQRRWPRLVKERAGWLCELCDSDDEVHAHHIIPIAEDPAQMDDIDNGICLCADCHTKVHTGEIILQLPLRMGSAINA